MPRLPHLYGTLRGLTEQVVHELASNPSRDCTEMHRSVIQATEPSFVLDEDGKLTVGEVRLLHQFPLKFVPEALDTVVSSAATRCLYDTLLDAGMIEASPFLDPGGSPGADEFVREDTFNGAGLVTFLATYLARLPALAFDLATFDELYEDFEAYHASDACKFRETVPLMNFSSEEDSIDLGDAARIVRLGRSELARLASKMPGLGVSPSAPGVSLVRDLLGSGFAIVSEFSIGKGEPLPARTLGKHAPILTVLRLVKPGSVFCNVEFLDAVGFHPVYESLGAGWTDRLVPHLPRQPLHLSADDALRAAELWEALEVLASKAGMGGLEIGLRRLYEMSLRTSREDKIIDMAILLESTLLHGITEELRYRLSLRAARLLSTSRDPQETFKLFKDFYDVRSAIVHAGKTLGQCDAIKQRDSTPEDFVDDTEAVCRDVLRSFVERVAKGESVQDIVHGLDRQALLN